MINMIGVTKENRLEKDITIFHENLSTYKWFWVDFNEPTDEELKHLSDTFYFHPLAIEDCIYRLQRPKLDYYDDYTFYVTHLVREIDKEIIKDELNFFISEKFIVTFHRMPSIEVKQVWDRLSAQEDVKKWDTSYVFYQVLDKIVDNYFPIIYKIEEELDKIEDYSQNQSMNHVLTKLFDTRNRLLNFRHTVNPMRDLLYRMINSHHLTSIQKRREYFSDIYDHLLKLSEMVMSNREITADIRDNYLSLNSHQTNNVMKLLTIITSIFAPLTLIAGIYGMNFENMPEISWKYGYLFSLSLMAIISVSMYFWFKSKGWFK